MKKPAVVLDIDETSLLNWPRIKIDDYAYIANGTCPQTSLARAVKPTLELY